MKKPGKKRGGMCCPFCAGRIPVGVIVGLAQSCLALKGWGPPEKKGAAAHEKTAPIEPPEPQNLGTEQPEPILPPRRWQVPLSESEINQKLIRELLALIRELREVIHEKNLDALFRCAQAALRGPPSPGKDAPSNQNGAPEPEKPKPPEPILKPAFLQALLPDSHLNSLRIKEKEALALNVLILAVVTSRECGESFYDVVVAGGTRGSHAAVAFLRGALCAALILERLQDEGGT